MRRKAVIVCALLIAAALRAGAGQPMTYKEIAMLLRNGEDQQYILKETTDRKLIQPLSKDEVDDLASLGATPALLNALRAPAIVFSQQEAAAYAARVQQQKLAMLRQEQQERLEAEQAAAASRPQTPQKAKPALAGSEYLGKPVAMKFTTADGSEMDTAKLRGKVVLIDFWASWDQPSMDEVSNVVAAYRKYHEQGFEIVGISLDKDKEAMLKVTSQKQMPWQEYFDGKGWANDVSSSMHVQSLPTMWLVDRNGTLVSNDARGHLDEFIPKLLGQ